jgi:hypothetical protein
MPATSASVSRERYQEARCTMASGANSSTMRYKTGNTDHKDRDTGTWTQEATMRQ